LDRFIKEGEVYAIVHREDNKAIESIELHHRPDGSLHQIGDIVLSYVLYNAYRGNGYMKRWNVPRIRVSHFKEDNASQRVIEKIGFIYENDCTCAATILNKFFDEHKYVLTKEDYMKRYKSQLKSK
jgi:RimJ/RimL family protein N-acetyltransferase